MNERTNKTFWQKNNIWEKMHDKPCFLFVGILDNDLRISFVNDIEKKETFFAAQKQIYAKEDIENISYTLGIKRIIFPDNNILSVKDFEEKVRKYYIEKLTDYFVKNCNKDIFLLKQTAYLKWYQNIKSWDLIVPVKLKDNRLILFKKIFSINGKDISFIPVFSSKEEYECFEKREVKKKMKEFSLLLLKIQIIKKNLKSDEGIFLNPCSNSICGLDFSFAMSYDFLHKYK